MRSGVIRLDSRDINKVIEQLDMVKKRIYSLREILDMSNMSNLDRSKELVNKSSNVAYSIVKIADNLKEVDSRIRAYSRRW